jgi:hypothetical protein
LAVLPLLGAAWLVAIAGSVGLVQWLLVPACCSRSAFALFGWTALRQLWFPIRLHAVRHSLLGLARRLSATHHCAGGRRMGDGGAHPGPARRHRVVLPVGSFEIVEGCSGMHYFVVAGTLATLYGWLWYRRWA